MESFNNFKRRKPRKFSISPRLKKLKEDFIKNGGKFEKYEIGNLFEIKTPSKKFNANTLKFGGKYPYVVRTSQNNGIRNYIDEDIKYLNPANTISFGQDTATIFYQEQPYFTGDKIKILSFKHKKLEQKTACFLLSVMNKSFSSFQWGQASFNVEILKKVKILLPTTNNKIDLQYMENYIIELEEERISELEEERISELTAYLKVSGLEDYKLTKDEQESIDKINKNTIKFQEFKIENVLNWQSQKEIDPLKIELLTIKNPIKYPFYGQATINNGIISYESLQDTVLNNKMENPTILIHSNNQNCVYLETPFYLKDGHGATSVLQNSELNKLNAQYIITCISKIITKKFNYNNKATKIALKNTKISLPVNKDNQIDYIFMETYIKAIEKLVIKNVVEWRDKQINATKQVVNNV